MKAQILFILCFIFNVTIAKSIINSGISQLLTAYLIMK